MAYNFTKHALIGEYEIFVDTDAQYGCFEFIGDHVHGYCEGGIWFEHKGDTLAVRDYDGVYEMPKEVVYALQQFGFDVSYITQEEV
jgi:hypothetical protein